MICHNALSFCCLLFVVSHRRLPVTKKYKLILASIIRYFSFSDDFMEIYSVKFGIAKINFRKNALARRNNYNLLLRLSGMIKLS